MRSRLPAALLLLLSSFLLTGGLTPAMLTASAQAAVAKAEQGPQPRQALPHPYQPHIGAGVGSPLAFGGFAVLPGGVGVVRPGWRPARAATPAQALPHQTRTTSAARAPPSSTAL